MKKTIYYLFGTIIISSMFKTADEVTTATDHCALTNDYTVLCYKNDRNVIPVIPDDIPLNIKRFILHNEHSNIPWLIHNSATFKRFSHLNSLLIRSSMQFSPELQKLEEKETLSRELFNLPRLINFTLYNCKIEGIQDIVWILPKNLERFHSLNSSANSFSLKHCPRLRELLLKSSGLLKMPELYSPSPPIHTLNLKGNPSLKLTLNDIAPFCNLTRISFDVKGAFLGSPEGYCECSSLKEWHQWLKDMNIPVKFDITPEWSCSLQEMDCRYDILDETKEKYKKVCLGEIPLETRVKDVKATTVSLWVYAIPAALVLILITAGSFVAAVVLRMNIETVETLEEENEDVEEEVHREN